MVGPGSGQNFAFRFGLGRTKNVTIRAGPDPGLRNLAREELYLKGLNKKIKSFISHSLENIFEYEENSMAFELSECMHIEDYVSLLHLFKCLRKYINAIL